MMISKIGNSTSYTIQKTQDAFTFIELMVTLIVLSLGLVFVLHALSSSIKATQISQDITRASFLAENKIEELEIKINKGIKVADHEQGKEDNIIWNYQITTPDDNSGLKKLTFQVSRQTTKKEKILEVITYLRGPT